MSHKSKNHNLVINILFFLCSYELNQWLTLYLVTMSTIVMITLCGRLTSHKHDKTEAPMITKFIIYSDN